MKTMKIASKKEFATLTELGIAMKKFYTEYHPSHRFAAIGAPWGAQWGNEDRTIVLVNCGLCDHKAKLEETRPGHFEWIFVPS